MLGLLGGELKVIDFVIIFVESFIFSSQYLFFMVNKLKLNKEQLKAINKIEGDLLIIASAGTGKTTTIVERYINMVENHGFKPNQILMTTFTNKAANDMIKKINKKTKKISKYIGTMHSLFLNILRNYAKIIFKNPDFTLLTEDNDKVKIIRQILKEKGINTRGDNIKYFLRWIAKFKNLGVLAENLSEDVDIEIGQGVVEEEINEEIVRVSPNLRKEVNKVYKKYQQYLKDTNQIDFDDILVLTHKLLEENKDIREGYKNQFKSIMVDEAQDLNVVQMKILDILQNNNLCLIGDDCQNIYEWRGSSNKLVFDFERNKDKIFLKENYRSNKKIISSVNKIIKELAFKIDKELICTREEGKDVTIELFSDFEDEIDFVVSEVKSLLNKNEKKEEIAVLFRVNRIGKYFEREFRKNKIPCHLTKSKGFFNREEIKDIVSFLKLKVNKNSLIEFERIILLMEGFGKSKVKDFEEISKEEECSLIDSFKFKHKLKLSDELSESLNILALILKDYTKNPISLFLNNFGYLNKLTHKYKKEADKLEDKLENIEVLKQLFNDYGNSKEQIKKFLDDMISLEKREKTGDKIILSTIHSAKGLEWKHVFLVCCGEGMLPFYTKSLGKLKKDSELRLFYVAVSRAKDNLTISHSDNVLWREFEPSHFLKIIKI